MDALRWFCSGTLVVKASTLLQKIYRISRSGAGCEAWLAAFIRKLQEASAGGAFVPVETVGRLANAAARPPEVPAASLQPPAPPAAAAASAVAAVTAPPGAVPSLLREEWGEAQAQAAAAWRRRPAGGDGMQRLVLARRRAGNPRAPSGRIDDGSRLSRGGSGGACAPLPGARGVHGRLPGLRRSAQERYLTR